jgi:hypothetical protein
MKFDFFKNPQQRPGTTVSQPLQLEMLTKGHPLFIWGMYLPFIIGMPAYAVFAAAFRKRAPCCYFLAASFSGPFLNTSCTALPFTG